MPRLLPYIEQEDLFELYRWDVAWNDPANQPAINTHLKILYCPSTPGGADRTDSLPGGGTCATCDYSPVSFVSSPLMSLGLVPQTPRFGAMYYDRFTPMADILDGTSNTLVIAEDAGRPQHWISEGRGPADNNNGCSNGNVTGGRVPQSCWAAYRNSIPLHGFSYDGLSCHGPCPINCTNNHEAFGFHPGGVQAVFADGTVHFLSETIDIVTYAALITRAGGEVIDSSAF